VGGGVVQRVDEVTVVFAQQRGVGGGGGGFDGGVHGFSGGG